MGDLAGPPRDAVRKWHLDYGFDLVGVADTLDVYAKRIEATGNFLVAVLDTGGTDVAFDTVVPPHQVAATVAGFLRLGWAA